ncbi:MAG: glycoside hydrolase family 2 TIM barrel-domain containing protein [Tepidisphaeraceae bacterium]|jgi:beta-galactosidase
MRIPVSLVARLIWGGLLFAGLAACTSQTDYTFNPRSVESFDSDWRFVLGDAPGAQGAEFDDLTWRKLDVPHDWSIEGTIDKDNSTGKSGGYFPAGIGWYRKHFTLPAGDAGRRVFVEFDGVMANSDVWVNGFKLGHRPYGYVGFRYELTGHLQIGLGDNVLAVRCDDSAQPASRWYSGAGIYRHVRLIACDPVHLDQYAPYVTTPEINDQRATVQVVSGVVNQSDGWRQVSVSTTIFGPDGKVAARLAGAPAALAPGKSMDVAQDLFVHNPLRWNIDQPNLYRAVTEVVADGKTVDDAATNFGIREFHFDPATGFWLNGKNVKIFGCALHSEGGAVGAAVPLGVWQRRLAAMKTVGCNAIRTAHNPPAPEFLDLCDRMGFLVMDEMFDVWTVGKTPLRSRTVLNDYHLYFKDWWQADVTDTVGRDRNHPSVILWSAGNEIHDISPTNDRGSRIFVPLRDLYHKLDPTRPVTLAVVRPNASHVYDNGFADLMDVVGQNYRENELLAAHAAKPERKIIGTENHQDLPTWLALRDHPAFSGEFVWTGVDYLGESIGWPMIAHESGLFDRTLWARPSAYQRMSWWTSKPMVRIARVLPPLPRPPAPATEPGMDPGPPPRPRYFSDWTLPKPGHPENLEVYTNCQQVELLLNGKSLGVQARHADDSPLTWKVAYEPGVLRALASNHGKTAATDELRTAGAPAKIVLLADQPTLTPTWDDVSFARATVTDADGVTVPDAADLIRFEISGPGRVAAVDNADVSSHEAFAATQRHAYHGRCLAIVKATSVAGPIRLTASAPGLEAASVDIQTVAPPSAK